MRPSSWGSLDAMGHAQPKKAARELVPDEVLLPCGFSTDLGRITELSYLALHSDISLK